MGGGGFFFLCGTPFLFVRGLFFGLAPLSKKSAGAIAQWRIQRGPDRLPPPLEMFKMS